jgi:hypothetical protein
MRKNFNHEQHEPSRTEETADILYKDECYKIYGCIYAVNKKLGAGFLEAVYQKSSGWPDRT